MTEQTKKPRTARLPGFQANVALFIPVDKNSLRSQNEVSTALLAAEQAGDLSAILALPGLRILAIKNPRFAPITSDAAAAKAEAGEGEGEQADIEDAISDSEGEAQAVSDDPADMPGDEGDTDVAVEEAQADDTYRGRRRR